MIGPISRVFEVQMCHPIVGEIFGHLTSSASRPGGNVTSHSRIKGISTDDMMNMRGRVRARFAGGVKALSRQGRAWEPKAGLGQRSK